MGRRHNAVISAQFMVFNQHLSAIVITHRNPTENTKEGAWAETFERFFDTKFAEAFAQFLADEGLEPTKPVVVSPNMDGLEDIIPDVDDES